MDGHQTPRQNKSMKSKKGETPGDDNNTTQSKLGNKLNNTLGKARDKTAALAMAAKLSEKK